jgi:hypothetical protein
VIKAAVAVRGGVWSLLGIQGKHGGISRPGSRAAIDIAGDEGHC